MNDSWHNSKALKWQYRLVENSQTRMRFALPRLSLFVIAFLCALFGVLILLSPRWFTLEPQFLVPIAGCLGVFLGLSLLYFVVTRSGEIIIDSTGHFVTVNFSSPKEHIARHVPFGDFIAIETRQYKDMHGLHNHWIIDLVGQDGLRIKLGSSFNGTFRKKVRDRIVNKMSEIIGIPVNHLD